MEMHGKNQTHVSLVTVIITVLKRACCPTSQASLQDELCNLGSQPEKQMAPPVTKTTVKKTKAADAAQQRSKSLTTGFIPQQIRSVTGDGCPKKGFR